jgi:hypothetical protein
MQPIFLGMFTVMYHKIEILFLLIQKNSLNKYHYITTIGKKIELVMYFLVGHVKINWMMNCVQHPSFDHQ